MSFDTVTFWGFFVVAWLAWRFLPWRWAKSVALVMSLGFYAWWNPYYLSLIAVSAGVDYTAGRRIYRALHPKTRLRWLQVSLVVNLGLLCVFKYAPFMSYNATLLAHLVGIKADLILTDWVIPVGISFYTFQTLSYTIDVYRGRMTPASSFGDFFLFVSFFPQLVAGPIVRARQLIPQLARRRKVRLVRFEQGLYHAIVGLFLKVVVADGLADSVNQSFSPELITQLTPMEAWLTMVYYSVQIFADFAGYSSIAIGLAYMMGLRFPRNFNYPYLSRGLSEFWSRWHMTLSTWLRDYLYVSLGGNRMGVRRTHAALMVTMLLGGLWHGASWTYVVWGLLHGIALSVERLSLGRERPRGPAAPPRDALRLVLRIGRVAMIYVFILITWVFFRADNFADAGTMLRTMMVTPLFLPASEETPTNLRYLVLVAPVFAMHLAQASHEWFGVKKKPLRRTAVATLCLFFLIIFRRGEGSDFIYFQF